MRIGILQTDSVLDDFQPEFGNYPAMFRGLLALEPSITFADYDVQRGCYPDTPAECDAYLITGSRKSVYDDEAWIHRLRDYVVELHQARQKLVGICFGHQMVAEALGGKTEPAKVGWRVGVSPNTVVKQEDFMDPAVDTFNLIFSHKDQVSRLPTGAEILATSPGCPIAMFRLENHILAFQGHPEFCKGYSRALMDFREDVLGPVTYGQGIESLGLDTHENTVARWILNFIGKPAGSD